MFIIFIDIQYVCQQSYATAGHCLLSLVKLLSDTDWDAAGIKNSSN